MKKFLLILNIFLLFIIREGVSQSGTAILKGKILDVEGKGIESANILLLPIRKVTSTDQEGNYMMTIPAGEYTLKITHLSYQTFSEKVTFSPGITIEKNIRLHESVNILTEVAVGGTREFNDVSFLPQVQGTSLFAGKKTQVVYLQNVHGDLAENNPRQMFAKVPGVMVWEMDGTGNQVSIATRGLNPHRSWELNARQNGSTINSDLFGYPEAHYNPPAEGVEKIELVRGSGALQYGPQFGGMLNYVIKKPDTTKKAGIETQQSVGSFGLFSSFNAVGGKAGKLTYYGYYNFRRSNGWRENSDYHFNAWHVSAHYAFSPKVNLSAELSHMDYINHFAAGLTDAMFEEDPRQSNRSRNYFNPTIYVPSLKLSVQTGKNTLITAQASAILGQRNSVQFIQIPTVEDSINPEIGTYNPRKVDRDTYHSYAAEIRLLHHYDLFENQNHFAAGVRIGDSKTLRRQEGKGTSGTDFDLSLTSDYNIDLTFRTINYAFFAENVFNLTSKLSVTPGFRLESIDTDMSGEIGDLPESTAFYERTRVFPLFGVGAAYDLTPLINLYGNITQAYRPILHSDIIPPTPLDVTDPDLKDAKGSNAEIGVRGQIQDVLQFDINYFSLQYNDRIGTLIEQDEGATYFYKTNVGNARNQGAEIFMEFYPFNLLKTAHAPNISFFTSTAFNDARYERGTIFSGEQNHDITGNRVENVPQWISRNGVTYRYSTFSATFQLSYVAEAYADALNTEFSANGVNGVIPSYSLFDFNLVYGFLDRYNVRFSLNNITNEHYFTRRATGYPGPGILPSDGRSFLISVGAKF